MSQWLTKQMWRILLNLAHSCTEAAAVAHAHGQKAPTPGSRGNVSSHPYAWQLQGLWGH